MGAGHKRSPQIRAAAPCHKSRADTGVLAWIAWRKAAATCTHPLPPRPHAVGPVAPRAAPCCNRAPHTRTPVPHHPLCCLPTQPKSKRAKVVQLTKADKQGFEAKEKLVSDVQESIDEYAFIYLFKVNNMRNSKLKDIRQKWRQSRFFMGRNKVLALAFGKSEEEEYKPGTHQLTDNISGNVGVLFSNQDPTYVSKCVARRRLPVPASRAFPHAPRARMALAGCARAQVRRGATRPRPRPPTRNARPLCGRRAEDGGGRWRRSKKSCVCVRARLAARALQVV